MAVLARNCFSASVVSGTVIWERSRSSSVFIGRQVEEDDLLILLHAVFVVDVVLVAKAGVVDDNDRDE